MTLRSTLLTFLLFGCTGLFTPSSRAQEKLLRIAPGGHMGEIWDIEVDNQGRVLTTGEDKTVKVWNSKEGYLEREILGQIGAGMDGINYTMALSSDNKYLAVAGWYGNTDGSDAVGAIRLYDYKKGKLLRILEGHAEIVMGLKFVPDRYLLVSADANGNLFCWNLETLTYWELPAVSETIIDLEINGLNYYTAEETGIVKMWDLSNSKKCIATYDKHLKSGEGVSEIAVDPVTGKVAVASGTTVYFLNKKLKEEEFYVNGTRDPIKGLAFSPSGQRLAVVSENNSDDYARVKVYDWMDDYWQVNGVFAKHTEYVGSVAFLDEQTVATAGGMNYELAIWKTQPGKKNTTVVHWLEGAGSRIENVSMQNNEIAFTRIIKDKDDKPAFDFVFNLLDRSIRPLDSLEQFPSPVHKNGAYVLERSDSKATLYVKKGSQTVASFRRERNEGYYHFEYTWFRDLIISGGGFGYIQVYNQSGQTLSNLVGQQGSITGMAITPDSSFLITSSDDQTIRIWDTKLLGKQNVIYPTASIFIAKNSEWVIWNEDGYFTASKKGASYVGYHVNQGADKEAKFYPFEQFDIKYNRPDIILQSLGVVDSSIIELYRSAYLKRLQRMGISEADLSGTMNLPVVQLKPGQVDNGKLKVTVTATDSLYEITGFHAWVNDVPVFGRQGVRVEKTHHSVSKNLEFSLMSGVNKVQIAAVNNAGVESLKETFTMNNPAPAQSDLYIVSVGVSAYKDSLYNLDYAAKDAQDVATLFSASSHYHQVHEKLLTNQEVTRENLVALKDFLTSAKPDDVVIFFIAGHGVLNKSLDYYFCTYNMDFNTPEKYGISYSELEVLFDGIRAIRKLLIMDTCHSGEVDKTDLEEVAFVDTENADIAFRTTNTTTSYREAQGLQKTNEAVKEMFNDLRRGTGATVISSAGGAEYAMESDAWKNGLFTYCLLEGLQTKNADEDKNGQIMLSELQRYIGLKVAEISMGRQMPTSRFENISLDYRIW